jgi:hypothetical protein
MAFDCPGIYTEALAEEIAKRFYYQNRFGMTHLRVTAFLDSIEVDVGDVINLNDYYTNELTPNFEDGNIQAVITRRQLQFGQRNRIVFDMIEFDYGEYPDFGA